MYCEVCHKVFDSIDNLKKHYYYEIRNNPNKKDFIKKCIKNLKSFRTYTCKFCGDQFTNQEACNEHVNNKCLPARLATIHKIANLLKTEYPDNSIVDRLVSLSDSEQPMKPAPNGSGSSTLISNLKDSIVIHGGQHNIINKINNHISFDRDSDLPPEFIHTNNSDDDDNILISE